MDQPQAKRLRVTVSVGGGGGEKAVALPASPGSRKLRPTLLVVLFLVQVRLRNKVKASLSQVGRMVQRHADDAVHKYHGLIVSELESIKGEVERKLESFQEWVESKLKELTSLYSNRHTDQHIRLERNHDHGTTDGSNTNIRLCFLNDLQSAPIYTNKNIRAESNAAIKIGIFEGNTMITTGPLSKLKVEILVLRGDFSDDGRESWTEEEFKNNIVQGRDGKGFVLGGDCNVRLNNGEASLGRLRFKEGSCRTRSRMFIVGARVCKSENTPVRIQEAVMKPVTVRDRRNEANEKRYPPELNDDVYRLEEISKDGAYHKRLQEARILTVQDFLKALNKNAKKLREEVLQIRKQHNSWAKMVKHAGECCLQDKHDLKAYKNREGNVMLFFNCVHQLVGAAFNGDYVTHDKFDPAHKAQVNRLKECAYDKLEDISFDYVMKNNFPEQISSSSNATAGPSFTNPPNDEVFHQGTEAAAENDPGHDEVQCAAEPLPTAEEHVPIATVNLYSPLEYVLDEASFDLDAFLASP